MPSGETSARAELRELLLRAVRRSCATSISRYADDVVQRALERLDTEASGEWIIDAEYRAKLAYTATIDAIRESREPVVEGGAVPKAMPERESERILRDRYRRVTAPPDASSARPAVRVRSDKARERDDATPARVVDRQL